MIDALETKPSIEEVFYPEYWRLDRTTLPSISPEPYENNPSYLITDRAARLTMLRAAPLAVANQIESLNIPNGQVFSQELVNPGTVVLYDMEKLVPGPLALRDPCMAYRDGGPTPFRQSGLDYQFGLSARELIDYRANGPQPKKGPVLQPGQIYTSGRIGRDRFYYLRYAWMELAVPTRGGNAYAHYLSIPVLDQEQLSAICKIPRMLAIISCFPDTFRIGQSFRSHYYYEDWFGDFRDGVKRVRSVEVMPPDDWEHTLEDIQGVRERSGAVRFLVQAGLH